MTTEDSDAPKQISTDKGTFTLGPVVGKGMYGCVYQGLHVEGGTFVAIKQVKLSSLPEDKYQGIQTEIELLQGLAHPNVVRYITCKSVSGYLNVVMEYVENGSLLRILNKFGKLPETLVAMYMSQVMQGLNYLHSEGVTHRDIKAANLLVTKDGTIKIADSGVASRLGNLDSPCWMAPESVESSAFSTKSDIWSVGCTVIELLTGKPPYYGMEPSAALFKITLDPHPPIPEGISVSCNEWLMMAFRRDPSERWTAGQLLSHKWLQDAKLAQEKSRRNLVSIENAQKAVDSAKIRRKSLLIQQRAGFSKRLQLEAELGLGLNEGKNSNELSNAAAAATSKSKGHRTKTKRAASSKELNDLLLATSTQSKELSVLDDLRGMLDDSIGNGNNSGSSNSSASARPAPTSASSGPSSGSETPAGASPVVQRREKQWHRKMTIGPIKEYESGSGKGGVEGAGGSEGNVEAGGAGRHKRKLTMSQLIEQENVDGDGEFAEWLELESASGNDKDTLMRENREFLQEKITEVYAKLRGSNGNGNNSYGYSGGSGGYGYGSSGIGGSIGNSGGSISGSGGSGSGSLGGGGLKDGEYFKLLEGLIDSVNEYAMVKEAAFEQVGMWPLVELLIEAPLKQETLQFYTIKTINKVVEGSGALMKMLGDCGGIVPMAYFISSPSQGVIDEVITFYEQMVGKSSELFLACNGVHYILTLLKTVYNNPMYGPDLTVSVLKIVLDTLNAEKGRPFFDVARTYLREGLLQSLVSIATGFKTNLEVGNLVGAALLAMARSDEVIKAWMCRREFVRGVWGLLEDGPETFRVSLLKAIELIAYTRENVELLAAEGAVKVLFDQLPRCGASPSLRHHIFAALRNIVSLNRDRQCELVGLGIVRQLCADVAEPGLKDDVIPFLCSLLKAVKKREEFERNNVADVFIALLADPAYHQKAIESLAWWLEKDAAYVRSKIGHDRIMRALASTVTHSNLWPQLMDPVLRMIRKSKTIAQKLGAQENFVNFVLRKLKKSSTEQIRTLLDILAVLCQRAKAKSDFVTKNNILEKLASLREIHSSKVVVASSIDELIEAIKTQQQQQQQ